MRRLRSRRWADLIEVLGDECEECGSKEDLQPDHLQPRDWKSREIWSDVRLRLLINEALEGKLQMLCGTCNRMKGTPRAGTQYESGF